MPCGLAAQFQSARPVRGATRGQTGVRLQRAISIRAPRAGRDAAAQKGDLHGWISIRAPRAGRDVLEMHRKGKLREISIRAPRAGRDGRLGSPEPCHRRNFNPRAPCGARLDSPHFPISANCGFQSARPVRGATAKMHKLSCIFCNKQPIEDRNPASGAGRQSHLYIHADRYACKTECEPAFNWLFTCRSHYIISVSSGK